MQVIKIGSYRAKQPEPNIEETGLRGLRADGPAEREPFGCACRKSSDVLVRGYENPKP